MTDDLAVPLEPEDPALAFDGPRETDPVTPTVDRTSAAGSGGPRSGGELHRPGQLADSGPEAAAAGAHSLPADPPRSAAG